MNEFEKLTNKILFIQVINKLKVSYNHIYLFFVLGTEAHLASQLYNYI